MSQHEWRVIAYSDPVGIMTCDLCGQRRVIPTLNPEPECIKESETV